MKIRSVGNPSFSTRKGGQIYDEASIRFLQFC